MNLLHGLKKETHKLIVTLDFEHSLIKTERGFTLIEVLIAIALLSVLSLGIINFSEFVITSSDSTIEEDKDFLQIETALSRLEWDFSQIYTPLAFDILMNPSQMTPGEGEIYNQLIDIYQRNQRFSQISYNGLPVPIFENPEKDEFIFLTTSNRRKVANSKQSRFAWVRYSLVADDFSSEELAVGETNNEDPSQDPTNAGSALVRQIYNTDVFAPTDIPWNNIKTQVLLRRVESFKFEFWNPQNQKFVENLDTIKNGIHRIYGIKVSVNFIDILGLERYTERIYRPLFPEFEPEDLYRFLRANPNGRNGNNRNGSANGNNSGNGTQVPNGEGENGSEVDT